MSVHSFIREDIQALTAYPIANIPKDFIKLDAMEVPYTFPETLQQELAQRLSQTEINRYPNPANSGLIEALRETFSIPLDAQIALGNGSDELIQLITQLVAKPNANMLCIEPSFVMYRHNAALFGLNYIGLPLHEDFTLNIEAVLQAIEQHRPALTFIAYPNNPTGVRFQREQIEQIIEKSSGLVVVDEAYGAFNDDSFMNLAGQYENLIVMRTLSKIGFAGLRIGYAAGHVMVMNELAKIIPPYNMNQLSLEAARFALEHIDVVHQHIDLLKNERERMNQNLAQIHGITVFPSKANFITIRLPDAETAFNQLYEQRILVKKLHGSHALLHDCLRLTLGTPEQNNAVLEVLKTHCQNQQKNHLPATSKTSKKWIAIIAAIVVLAALLILLYLNNLQHI